jgi:hypothetical protein
MMSLRKRLRKSHDFIRISATLSPAVGVMLEKIAETRHGNKSYAIEDAIRHEYDRLRKRLARAQEKGNLPEGLMRTRR